MTYTKDILKAFGAALRSSNPKHQAALRAKLAERGIPEVTPTKAIPLKHLFFIGSWAMVGLVLVIATRPSPVAYDAGPVAYDPGIEETSEQTVTITNALKGRSGLAEVGSKVYRAVSDTLNMGYSNSDIAFGIGESDITMTGASPDSYGTPPPVEDPDVIDYEREHGSMLDTTTNITLMTTKRGVSTEVANIMNALGGHVSRIETYTVGQQTIIGTVPADSYFLFKEQMRDLVDADRYMIEILNATDLAPSAVTVDRQIDETTASIDELKKQINETKDDRVKAALEKRVTNLEKQRENLHKSLSSLDDRAAFATVSVQINEIPNFWKSRTTDDFKQLVAGFERPSYFQQAWINILVAICLFLQLFSVTFWLLIPLAIWLANRARTKRAWKALE